MCCGSMDVKLLFTITKLKKKGGGVVASIKGKDNMKIK